jgi:hypothetical protein
MKSPKRRGDASDEGMELNNYEASFPFFPGCAGLAVARIYKITYICKYTHVYVLVRVFQYREYQCIIQEIGDLAAFTGTE